MPFSFASSLSSCSRKARAIPRGAPETRFKWRRSSASSPSGQLETASSNFLRGRYTLRCSHTTPITSRSNPQVSSSAGSRTRSARSIVSSAPADSAQPTANSPSAPLFIVTPSLLAQTALWLVQQIGVLLQLLPDHYDLVLLHLIHCRPEQMAHGNGPVLPRGHEGRRQDNVLDVPAG